MMSIPISIMSGEVYDQKCISETEATKENSLVVVNPVRIISVFPTQTSDAGNVPIQLRTSGLVLEGIYCSFGTEHIVPAKVVEHDLLMCYAPRSQAGIKFLRIMNDDLTSLSQNAILFTYYARPRDVRILLNQGALLDSSSQLRIRTSTHFGLKMNITCFFDTATETFLSTASLISKSVAICRLPSYLRFFSTTLKASVWIDGRRYVHHHTLIKVGSMEVTVRNPEHMRSYLTGGQVFALNARIVGPALGMKVESTSCYCQFLDVVVEATICKISNATTFTVYSECISPPMFHPECGYLGFSINGQDFHEVTPISGIEYKAKPMIVHFSPHIGSPLGGTELLIRGLGFDELIELHCQFSCDMSGQPKIRRLGTVMNETTLKCTTPAAEEFKAECNHTWVDVSWVTEPFQSKLDSPFHYWKTPVISSLTSDQFPVNTNSSITVFGYRFSQFGHLQCRLSSSGLLLPAMWLSAEEITCYYAKNSGKIGIDSLDVSVNGQEWSNALTVDITKAFKLKGISPTSLISCLAGTKLVVEAEGLATIGQDLVFCRFNERIVLGRRIEEARVECLMPDLSDSTAVHLALLITTEVVTADIHFQCVHPPRLLQVLPRAGLMYEWGTRFNLTMNLSITSTLSLDMRLPSCCTTFGGERLCQHVSVISIDGDIWLLGCLLSKLTTDAYRESLQARILIEFGADESSGMIHSNELVVLLYSKIEIKSASPMQLILGRNSFPSKMHVIGSNFADGCGIVCNIQLHAQEATHRYTLSAIRKSGSLIQCILANDSILSPWSTGANYFVGHLSVSFDNVGSFLAPFDLTFFQRPEIFRFMIKSRSLFNQQRSSSQANFFGRYFTPELNLSCLYTLGSAKFYTKIRVTNSSTMVCDCPAWMYSAVHRLNHTVSLELHSSLQPSILWSSMHDFNNQRNFLTSLQNIAVLEAENSWQIEPTRGDLGGGTGIQIKGAILPNIRARNELVECCFNDRLCTPVVYVRPPENAWYCISPPHAALNSEDLEVIIELRAGVRRMLVSEETVLFVFRPRPNIHDVFPTRVISFPQLLYIIADNLYQYAGDPTVSFACLFDKKDIRKARIDKGNEIQCDIPLLDWNQIASYNTFRSHVDVIMTTYDMYSEQYTQITLGPKTIQITYARLPNLVRVHSGRLRRSYASLSNHRATFYELTLILVATSLYPTPLACCRISIASMYKRSWNLTIADDTSAICHFTLSEEECISGASISISSDGDTFSNEINIPLPGLEATESVPAISRLQPDFGTIGHSANVWLSLTPAFENESNPLNCVIEYGKNEIISRALSQNKSHVECLLPFFDDTNSSELMTREVLVSSALTLHVGNQSYWRLQSNHLVFQFIRQVKLRLVGKRAFDTEQLKIQFSAEELLPSQLAKCQLRRQQSSEYYTTSVAPISSTRADCIFFMYIPSGSYVVLFSINGYHYEELDSLFVIQKTPIVDQLVPGNGSVTGRSFIHIHGKHIAESVNLCFDDHLVLPSKYIGKSTVKYSVPATFYAGTISLFATIAYSCTAYPHDSSTSVKLNQTFKYLSKPAILGTFPTTLTSVNKHSGDQLDITGQNLDSTASILCKFDVTNGDFHSESVQASVQSPVKARCKIPDWSLVNRSLTVVVTFVEVATLYNTTIGFSCLQMLPVSYIELIQPLAIPLLNDSWLSPQLLRLEGIFSYGNQHPECHFSCKNRNGSILSVHQIFGKVTAFGKKFVECSITTLKVPMTCDVTIWTADGSRLSNNARLIIAPPIELEEVLPASILRNGELLLRVRGSGFDVNSQIPLYCVFGLTLSSRVTVHSDEVLTCNVPMLLLNEPFYDGGIDIDMYLSTIGLSLTSKIQRFTYENAPRILSVQPKAGFYRQDIPIRIRLSRNLVASEIKCVFMFMNTHKVVLAYPGIGKMLVHCTATKDLPVGEYKVGLMVSDIGMIENPTLLYTVLNRPILVSISPPKGFAKPSMNAKRSLLTLHGENFFNSIHLRCEFYPNDGTSQGSRKKHETTLLHMVSSWIAQCFIPPSLEIGQYIVSVVANSAIGAAPPAVTYAERLRIYEALSPMSVYEINPLKGYDFGGTVIRAYGVFSTQANGFLECVFGSRAVFASIKSNSYMECVSPPMQISKIPLTIRICTNLAEVANVKDEKPEFQVIKAPRVDKIVPSLITRGKHSVSIILHGEALDVSGLDGCLVGGVMYILKEVRNGRLELQVDVSVVGSYSIVLVLAKNIYPLLDTLQHIQVISQIIPLSMTPDRFDERGGLQMLISALQISDFATSIHCRFGNVIVEALWASQSQILCTTPSQHPGSIRVSLSQDGQLTWSSVDLYGEVYRVASLLRVWPSSTTLKGGTTLSVSGTGFHEAPPGSNLRCLFSFRNLIPLEVEALYLTQKMVRCRVPDLYGTMYREMAEEQTLVMHLKLSLNTFEMATNSLEITVHHKPVALRLLHISYDQNQGNSSLKVSISGRYFVKGLQSELECRFNNVRASGYIDITNSTHLKCHYLHQNSTIDSIHSSLTLAIYHNENLLLRENLGGSSFLRPIRIHGTSLSTGLVSRLQAQRSSSFYVYGIGFQQETRISCVFKSHHESSVLARFLSLSTLVCNIPYNSPGSYTLHIVCVKTRTILATFPIRYLHAPLVHDLLTITDVDDDETELRLYGKHFDEHDDIGCVFSVSDTNMTLSVPTEFISPVELSCKAQLHEALWKIDLLASNNVLVKPVHKHTFELLKLCKNLEVIPSLGAVGRIHDIHLQCRHGNVSAGLMHRIKIHLYPTFNSEKYARDDTGGIIDMPVAIKRPGKYRIYVSVSGHKRHYYRTKLDFIAHKPLEIFHTRILSRVAGQQIVVEVHGYSFAPWMDIQCELVPATQSFTQQSIQSTHSDAVLIDRTKLVCVFSRFQLSILATGIGTIKLLPLSIFNSQPSINVTLMDFTEVLEIQPKIGPLVGATIVSVLGRGFFYSGEFWCQFGFSKSPATYINRTLLQCRSPSYFPAHAIRNEMSVGFDLLYQVDQKIPSSLRFTYTIVPKIQEVGYERRRGTPEQYDLDLPAPKLWLKVHRLEQLPFPLFCQFSTSKNIDTQSYRSPAAFHETDTMKCTIPNTLPAGENFVRIVYPPSAIASNKMPFQSYTNITVSTIYPEIGSAVGGYRISIHGDGFPQKKISCRFLTNELKYFDSDGEVSSPTLLFCIVPTLLDANEVLSVVRLSLLLTFTDPVTLDDRGEVYYHRTDAYFFVYISMLYKVDPQVIWFPRKPIAFSVFGDRIPFSQGLKCLFSASYHNQFPRFVDAIFKSEHEVVCLLYPSMALDLIDSASGTAKLSLDLYLKETSLRKRDELSIWIAAIPEPITSIVPSIGSMKGGEMLTIYGNFSALKTLPRDASSSLACVFDAIHFSPVLFMADTEIKCGSTATDRLRTSFLALSLKGNELIDTGYRFRYVSGPTFSHISPRRLPQYVRNNDAKLYLHGTNLHIWKYERLSCIFVHQEMERGIRYISEAFINHDSNMQCINLPAFEKLGIFDVRIQLSNINLLIPSNHSVEVMLKPVVNRVHPRTDTIFGGSRIVFSGHNFFYEASLRCMFEDQYVAASMFSKSEIVCVAPPSSQKSVNVSLIYSENGAVPYSTSVFPFTYVGLPELRSFEVNTDVNKLVICTKLPAKALYVKLVSGNLATMGSEIEGIETSFTNVSCRDAYIPYNVLAGVSTLSILMSVNDDKYYDSGAEIPSTSYLNITHVAPTFGSFRGKDLIHWYGHHIAMVERAGAVKLLCVFQTNGIILTSQITVVSDSELLCPVPYNVHKGISKLQITSDDGSNRIYTRQYDFRIVGPMEITSISPKKGYNNGGTVLTILAIFINSTMIRCKTPHVRLALPDDSYQHEEQNSASYLVRTCIVTVTLQSVQTESHEFQHIRTPSVQEVAPKLIVVTSKLIRLHVRGYFFANGTYCHFGLQDPIIGQYISTQEIVCSIRISLPLTGMSSSEVQLELSVNRLDRVFAGPIRLLNQPVRVHEVCPRSLIPAITRYITLKISSMQLEYLYTIQARIVCFYKESNSSIISTWASESEIACAVPKACKYPRLDGTQTLALDLRVDENSLLEKPVLLEVLPLMEILDYYYTESSNFSEYPRIRSPDRHVMILGRNFIPMSPVVCRIGKQQMNGLMLSRNRMRCSLPNTQTDFDRDLSISYNDGIDFTSVGHVTFVDELVVQEIHPQMGSSSGGTLVRISGRGFMINETITCAFGMYRSPEQAEIISNSEIICVSTVSPSDDLVDITLQLTSRRTYMRLEQAFQYQSPIIITSYHPTEIISAEYDLVIEVRGANFIHSSSLQCQFTLENPRFSRTVQAVWHSSSYIQCIVPAHVLSLASPSLIRTEAHVARVTAFIGVSNNRIDFVRSIRYARSSKPTQILIFQLPDIRSIYPAFGPLQGGTPVRVESQHISRFSQIWCLFGSEVVKQRIVRALFISAHAIICRSPLISLNTGFSVPLKISPDRKHFTEIAYRFLYMPAPDIHEILPIEGDMRGSTLVTVHGKHFIPDGGRSAEAWCRFGDTKVRVIARSNQTISCYSPQSESPQIVPFEISINGVDYTDNGKYYEHVRTPKVLIMHPSMGPMEGNTFLTLSGYHYHSIGSANAKCCFGDQIYCSQALAHNSTRITCISPMMSSQISLGQDVLVYVSLNGQDFHLLKQPFVYYVRPVLHSLEITRFGLNSEKTHILISGRGFFQSKWLVCRVTLSESKRNGRDLHPVIVSDIKANYVNSTAVRCPMPERPAIHYGNLYGTVDISENCVDFSFQSLKFEYFTAPLIDEVEPNLVSSMGQTDLNISYSHSGKLGNTDLFCEFVCNQVYSISTAATILTDTTITCKAPAFDMSGNMTGSNLFDAEVFIKSQGLKSNSLSLEVIRVSTLVSLSPDQVFSRGGSLLNVYGISFPRLLSMKCCFDGGDYLGIKQRCSNAKYVSSSEIRCVVPSGLASHSGKLSTSIKYETQQLSVNELDLYLDANVVITHSAPNSGSSLGGTMVYVSGQNFKFTPHISCCFGDSIVRAIGWVERKTIICITVAHADGDVPLSISYNGRDCSTDPRSVLSFTFEPTPTIQSIKPSIFSREGGTQVIIRGSFFLPNKSVAYFGQVASTDCHYRSDTELHCFAPAQSSHHAEKSVRVSNNQQDLSSDSAQFTYVPLEQVRTVHPHYLLIDSHDCEKYQQEEYVSVKTRFIRNTPNLRCIFIFNPSDPEIRKVVYVDAIFDGSDLVRCLRPTDDLVMTIMPKTQQMDATYRVHVHVSNDPGAKSTTFASIGIILAPAVYKVTPLMTLVNQTQMIVISGTRLHGISHCRFGDQAVSVYASNLSVACNSPNYQRAGNYSLTLLMDSTITVFCSKQNFQVVDDRNLPQLSKARRYILPPDILTVSASQLSNTSAVNLIIHGRNFRNTWELTCRLGKKHNAKAFYKNSNEVFCHVPLTKKFLEIEVSNDGVIFSSFKDTVKIKQDVYIKNMRPRTGSVLGGTVVTFYGDNLRDSESLFCLFGATATPVVKAVNSSQIVCITPPKTGNRTIVSAGLCTEKKLLISNELNYTYTDAQQLLSVTPASGTQNGGTPILIEARYLEIRSYDDSVLCRFISMSQPENTDSDVYIVSGVFRNVTHAACTTPSVKWSGSYRIQISTNEGGDFTTLPLLYHFEEEIQITRLVPSLGPALAGGTVITVHGNGFMKSKELSCFFDGARMLAIWQSDTTIKCNSSSHAPNEFVFLRVSNNGVDLSNKSVRFFYHRDVSITSFFPSIVSATGGTPIHVQGRNFLDHLLLSCRFGEKIVKAVFISETALLCISPTRILTSGHRFNQEKVSLEVSLNRVDFTELDVPLVISLECPSKSYCSAMNSTIQPCLAGHMCPGAFGSASSRPCPPGMFQPRESRSQCASCPIGFYCPFFGMSVPLVCLAGRICDSHKLRTPLISCPQGHYCKEGTKSTNTFDRDSIDPYPDIMAMSSAGRNNEGFIGQYVLDPLSSSRIQNTQRHFSRILVGDTLQSGFETESALGFSSIPNPAQTEKPYPCPIGTYCLGGVRTQLSVPGKFDTPQNCFDGFFCPFGSSAPEGRGPCPTGYYCPKSTDAIGCPVGHYCPGVGNVRPKPCIPGSYNPDLRRSSCTICSIGFVCPKWSMEHPILCPAGFVCNTAGLPAPVLLCPPGYYCEAGTETSNPEENVLQRPQPCPKGTYCLGGVAHNRTTEWLPTQPQGSKAPQRCEEGTYCKNATPSISGAQICFPGHYCPPGTDYPVQVPVGSYASVPGSLASSLCFPGTFTSLPGATKCELCPAGYTCPYYGTYIPSICPKGYYRSVLDGITCRPCPKGTWSSLTGLTDISFCEICPAGIQCNSVATSNLSLASFCAPGYVCGDGTTEKDYMNHVCPAGTYCYNGTTSVNEYERACEPGYMCTRGTKNQEKNRNECPDGSFCPNGSSNTASTYMSCPRGTWTNAGAKDLSDCAIRAVDVCDRDEDKHYYQRFSYTYKGRRVRFDSTYESSRTGEIEAVRVINPIIPSESTLFWRNDTVDVFRSCPRYGVMSGGFIVTIVGKHFYDTKRVTCRFLLEDMLDMPQDVPASFIDSTRVQCRAPPISSFGSTQEGKYVQIRVSNYGLIFSATFATMKYVSDIVLASYDIEADLGYCLSSDRYETEDRFVDKRKWLTLRGLSKATISFDFRHIPPDLIYDEHYKVAIYVQNSTCAYQACSINNPIRSGADDHTSPCRLPLNLPEWFTSPNVDKHDIMNLTLYALEDIIFNVEIHVLYGLYSASASLFSETAEVQITSPSRSNVTLGNANAATRTLSQSITPIQEEVTQEYTFLAAYFAGDADYTLAPLNLAPKYQSLERGRVLVSHNVSNQSRHVPLILGPDQDLLTAESYWQLPYSTAAMTYDMVLKYREIFQEMYVDPSDPTRAQYNFAFSKILLSYFPFFSNCMEYDSYIPIFDVLENDRCALPPMTSETGQHGRNWWRRKFSALPNQDNIDVVGPLDFMREPVADICNLAIQCHYEENLENTQLTSRWFEQSQDTKLFYLLREAASFDNFLKNGNYYDKLLESHGSDYFIPVTVDTSGNKLKGDCTHGCFPRKVTLKISYYQVTKSLKRIIKAFLVYEDYDRDTTKNDYVLQVDYSALDYMQLIIQFAFERQVFITLFIFNGGVIIGLSFLFWIIHIITALIESKSTPKFRFWSMFALTAPPIAAGSVVAILPVSLIVAAFYFLLNGVHGRQADIGNPWLLDHLVKHYIDPRIDAGELQATRYGRSGFCFFVLASYLIFLSTSIFISQSVSISERALQEKSHGLRETQKIWWPTQWKRANMVFTTIILCVALVLLIEFSFWSQFGHYLWFVIVGLELLAPIVEGLLAKQLQETLLVAPLASSYALVSGLITFGASDFKDFVVGNLLDFGVSLIERVYLDASIKGTTDFGRLISRKTVHHIFTTFRKVRSQFRELIQRGNTSAGADNSVREKESLKRAVVEKSENEKEYQTVEPIIEFYIGHSMDKLALFYQPVLIILMILFRNELQLPILYNIREKDMEFYLWYSLIILLFQVVSDAFVLNVVEYFREWKLYDYLVYSRYRFLHREHPWKGMEPYLDECIEPNLRTLDQMCFSSQLFLMCTLHMTGVVFFVFAIEIMVRWKYNFFGDPAAIILALFVIVACIFVKQSTLYVLSRINFRNVRNENNAWTMSAEGEDEFGVPKWEDIEKYKEASHEAYLMNQRITSETFRNKFLKHNRSWLIEQLPTMLTPRTINRTRPLLLEQFSSIVDPFQSASSDSDEDEDDKVDGKTIFGPIRLSTSSNIMIQLWLAQARRLQRLQRAVQPIIQQARKAQCEMCLSYRHLQVQLLQSIDSMGEHFEKESPSEKFDAEAWKEYFKLNEKFKTICVNCIRFLRERDRSAFDPITDQPPEQIQKTNQPNFGRERMIATSNALMQSWYFEAKKRRVREELNSQKTPVHLDATSSALARRWLLAVRQP
uniref:Uncharacterized protein AlNc14C165G7869 n=1 Tax=Albugo laibachii Nc14 TaxID=890382 RepID=F0WN37_9STRA|nr:conserved hypothetical protein [Albugo laibachii Nc14]|eukprot:CCA22724.1 conserved hypothetical protein [Albugo laibachii Nc14]